MVDALLADVGSQIPGEQRGGHVGRLGDGPLEHVTHERRRAEHTARDAEREPRRVTLHRRDVIGRNVVEGDRVHEDELLDPLRPRAGQMHCDRGAEVDANDRGRREAKRGQRVVQVIGLCGHPVLFIEGTVGFAVAEEVDGKCRPIGQGEARADVAPEETARAKPV